MVSSGSRLQKDQRLEVIRRAALKKMLEFGVESVSIRAIAKEAKISETLLYRHYTNKYAILYDLFLNEFTNIAEKVETVTDTLEVMVTDLSVSLPALTKILKKILAEYQELIQLIIREEERINHYLEKGRVKFGRFDSKKSEMVYQQILSQIDITAFRNYFQRCKDDGNLKDDLDPEVCFMMLGTVIWQTVLKNPYKYFHPNIDDKYFEYLLDSQIKILIAAMKP